MTWTYSGDPSSSARDEVRYLIGDTNEDDQQLSDQEIAWAIAQYPSQGAGYPNFKAAILLVNGLISKYTSSVSKTVGSLSINRGDKATKYRELLVNLKEQAAGTRKMGLPVLGGGGPTYLMGNDWNKAP